MTNVPQPELASLAERISGPVKGYYLASYAVLSQVGYEGYAKICNAAPRDVWDCHAILKVWSGSTWSVETALQIAEQVALATIGSLDQDNTSRPLT